MFSKYTIVRLQCVICSVLLLVSYTSCKKNLEVNAPVTGVTGENVYNSDATAAAVLTGLYTRLNSLNFNQVSLLSISVFAGLSSDELTLFKGATNASQNAYYKNNLSPTIAGFELWNLVYPYIFTCNSAIEGLSNSKALTPAIKDQLIGESKFMRAFFYFYLTNLYGDLPLALTTDFKINSQLGRTPRGQVYEQIIQDLKDAKDLLSSSYLKSDAYSSYSSGQDERVRPTKWAASALLARVYLFNGNYLSAENESSVVINNASLFSLIDLDKVFLKNSNESILQFQPVNKGWNTEDARFFIIPSNGFTSSNPVYLSDFLLNNFELGDNRKTTWIKSYKNSTNTFYYAFKYRSAVLNANITEYQMVLRLAEQYLIRAEARAQQNNIVGAQADLNILRKRAGLQNTTASVKENLLSAILNERQVELFCEWGHRWLDLSRTGNLDSKMNVVRPVKAEGAAWQPYQRLYPLPIQDIQKDASLIQNSGY